MSAGGVVPGPGEAAAAVAARSPTPPAPGDGDQRGPVTIVAHDVGSVGGMERQLAELIAGLRRLGREVSVIAWTCELPADVEGVEFHRVRGPRRPFLLGYPAFMLAGSLAVRRYGRGVVQATGAIVLGRVDAIAIHCCHQVYRESPRRASPLFRLYTRLLGSAKRAGERLCLRLNRDAALVCVSEGVATEMRSHYPTAAGRVVTIHNGVDTASFAPGRHREAAEALRAELGLDPRRLLAAFVARGWGHKGLDLLIEALREAPEWDLLVAGSGDERRHAELARASGVGGAVHWLGVRQDIGAVYELADAFVLPSSYETFSLVVFEAAATGLPVLATPVSGVRELIDDGRSGLIIERSPRSIAEHLRELAADPALRARLGAAAREAALGFTWEAMTAAHDRLYAELERTRARR